LNASGDAGVDVELKLGIAGIEVEAELVTFGGGTEVYEFAGGAVGAAGT
jgi:hypothetical protein